MKPKQHHVYYLIDPRNDAVMYVGSTVDPERRLLQHIAGNTDSTKNWIQELGDIKPRMMIVWKGFCRVRTECLCLEQEHIELQIRLGNTMLLNHSCNPTKRNVFGLIADATNAKSRAS